MKVEGHKIQNTGDWSQLEGKNNFTVAEGKERTDVNLLIQGLQVFPSFISVFIETMPHN